MTDYWVVYSLMKPIDVDELINNKFIISELEYSLTDDDKVDTSGVAYVRTESSAVEEVVQEDASITITIMKRWKISSSNIDKDYLEGGNNN